MAVLISEGNGNVTTSPTVKRRFCPGSTEFTETPAITIP